MVHQPERPWYVDMVKEIGGLGLVLVMLVGLYFLANDFGQSMNTTWQDIKKINETELEEDRMEREHLRSTISRFISEQAARMTEQSERMRMIEDTLSKLEK